ncbi:nacht domain-containing protein [Fusarium mundagurra]|uniref:Nacht domain-containing protein n=1 Tax=Fusarium mundagurra TaxID=1567541 RepID=A0A8H5XUK2_9HYPO|nr:nacht domain-containing protein [Fusarium mundagurra]
MASSSTDQVSEVFEKAKAEFLNGIKDQKLRRQLQNATTIDDIWDYTEQLQKDQASNKRLRSLKRIGPYIERLQEYAGVIEVFVQAKPDILALIWGPIKFLLQVSSNLVASFDAILGVMKNMGSILPRFNEFVPLFKNNERMKYVLGLFFQDILDFYLVSLRFFGLTRWKVFFESLWPARRAEIQVIAENIEKHRLLLCNEITLNDILEAHTARKKALEHYAETREFQERQDFHSMETYIRPPSYDEDLDRIRNGRCEGTGSWLVQDQQFVSWAEGKEKSSQVLWLQGIPGAGKTFLASTAIDRVKDLGHSLFVFLSYRYDLNSPIPIYHSLIFQLASQDRDLRTVLCSTIMSTTKDLKRDLKGDSKFALNTFTKLLQVAGPTYITIDGLDEIDDCTQQVFLHLLLDVLKGLPHVKLLVSSRRVERIERILKPIAMILPIDQKNSRCIEAYVSHRGGEWLDNSFFDSDARSEVQQLLKPLASKADGMFLYARIVLEDVEMLQDLDSIRDQLSVLPEGLDEAYERILQRITKYPSAAQKQCKKILSWIACSPVQITRHEMEQALIIQTDKRSVPQVRSTLNTLRLCGPLVEVEDEHLKFVHFTVKEYLLQHQKNKILDEGEALLEISTTCLAYLCSDCLDPDLSDDDLERNVISGAYRLLSFAHRQWAECLGLCTRHFRDELSPQFVPLLRHIMRDLENPDYNQDSETNLRLWSLDRFKSNLEEAKAISRSLDFRSIMATSYDWRLDEGNTSTHNRFTGPTKTFSEDASWAHFDPTTFSATTIRIHRVLQGLLCSESKHTKDCHCSAIQKHYGLAVNTCPFISCRYHRFSFKSTALRDEHIRHHDRPFKCALEACEYSTLGFSSRGQLENHLVQCHHRPNEFHIPVDLDTLQYEDLKSLVMEYILRDEVQVVERILPSIISRWPSKSAFESAFGGLLASHGSVAMARLVFGEQLSLFNDIVKTSFVPHAIKSCNIPVVEWALSNSTLAEWKFLRDIFSSNIMASDSVEVFDSWRNNVLSGNFGSMAISEYLVGRKWSPVMELQLASFWIELSKLGYFYVKTASSLLRDLASGSCSLVLAKALVTCGADVNYRSKKSSTDLRPLHHAIKKTSAEAAELVKYLLLSGADPHVKVIRLSGKNKGQAINLSLEPGAKGISKWLGKTWDELVEWAAEERRKTSAEESSSISSLRS